MIADNHVKMSAPSVFATADTAVAWDKMARPLYVVGGQQAAPRSVLDHDQQWYDYQQGLILQVDPAGGQTTTRMVYVSPPGTHGPGQPVLFKAGTAHGDRLFVCTQTEVLVYTVPSFTQAAHISLPCFNDVHHACLSPAGHLLVAVSGLDLVVEVDLNGKALREWDVWDGKPWTRFSKQTDYRYVASTKPHKSHPNYVFCVGDEIWATRFEQKDALCLNRPGRQIEIGIERVHDGFSHAGKLYFTTVNGRVVIANPDTLQVEEVIDLTELHDPSVLLGWCRGILVQGSLAWVGFSRIRPTRFREAVSWVRQGFKVSQATHIALYDLAAKRCLGEIELESHGLNAVFSILPADTGGQA
jgi:hypothetical protein